MENNIDTSYNITITFYNEEESLFIENAAAFEIVQGAMFFFKEKNGIKRWYALKDIKEIEVKEKQTKISKFVKGKPHAN